MKKISISLLLCSSSLVFVACESGPSSGGDTIRPQTMNDLVITSPQGDQFEFVRSFSSGAAENPGDVEVGAFFYTSGGTNIQLYPSLTGDNSDVQFPDAVNIATYEYLAVNDSSAILTLTGQAVNDLNTTGNFNANNGSFTFFFTGDSAGIPSNQVIIDLTFESSAQTITGITSTWAIAGSAVPNIDTVIIPATLTTLGGGLVPAGFSPELDLDRPSRLVPDTFTGLVFAFTDDDGTEPEVRLQFAADPGPVTVENVEETGQALQRVAGGVVISGANYMAERTPETSDVELILSGGNNDQDGTYTLSFEAPDSGVVTQTSGNGALLIGRFLVFDDGLL